MTENGPTLLTGNILIDEQASAFSGATVNVFLEDVSRQDDSSQVVQKQVIRNVEHLEGEGQSIAFAFKGKVPNPESHYIVRVHIDLNGNDSVDVGDLVTMESFPVLTRGHPSNITVRVNQIK
ncbi:YbaY family lipoprotein [Candidatus Nitrospira neomarina]|uniref:YbaY family lipoprotein n=1 Tax=Candidatus Nitrospira neomarina TaxID=3020899 RepID=A0AA96GU63_9BACT|nr:YbaY family lipoprotein [Candidatus Nitrospira neomarina]WNM63641.1 YbaY family lipoprotein [Candidatus Nitrospira neomarina]